MIRSNFIAMLLVCAVCSSVVKILLRLVDTRGVVNNELIKQNKVIRKVQ